MLKNAPFKIILFFLSPPVQLMRFYWRTISHHQQQKIIVNLIVDQNLFFTTSVSLGKGRGQHAVIKLGVVEGMPKNLSFDWSTRFMRVIFLWLSLVRTS